MLRAAREGRSALLVAPTGAGKTMAGFLPSLVELTSSPDFPEPVEAHSIASALSQEGKEGLRQAQPRRVEGDAQLPVGEGLHTLYISPLKALAVDVQRNLLTPIAEMGLNIRVETRTGDTPSDRKARQRARPPQMLLTTPEIKYKLLS